MKFSRLTRRGVLLGLSGSQLVVVGVGAVTLVFALYVGGGSVLLYVAPILLVCAALALVGVGGRKLVEWLPVVIRWLWRSTGGQLLFRRRIVKPRPAGTLALPGDAARLRQWLDPETGAVMVHDPHRATLTAIVGVTHPAFILLDPVEQQRRVASWGRVLATACRSGRIASLQVMERTLPDSGKGLAEWWSQHGRHDGSWTSTTYGELIDRAGPAGERHASTVSISLDLKAAGRAIRAAGGGNRGAAAVLRQEMSTLTAALRAADLAPSGWLEPGDLAVILRSAYDPVVAGALERHGDLGRDLATAGPVAVSESWSQPAQRLRAPLRAVDQRVAAVAGLPGLPRPRAAVLRRTPDLHPALHADAHRPGRPRHPQEEDRVHLRRRPTPADRPDRGRPADRRVQRRPPAGGRPHRRPRHPPRDRTHRDQRPSNPTSSSAPSPTSSRPRSRRPARPGGSGVSRPRRSPPQRSRSAARDRARTALRTSVRPLATRRHRCRRRRSRRPPPDEARSTAASRRLAHATRGPRAAAARSTRVARALPSPPAASTSPRANPLHQLACRPRRVAEPA